MTMSNERRAVMSYYPNQKCRRSCRLRPPENGLVSRMCLACSRCTFSNGKEKRDLYQPEHGWFRPKDPTKMGNSLDQHEHYYEYRTAICVSMQTDPTNPKYFITEKEILTENPEKKKCPICEMILQEREENGCNRDT